VPKATSNTPQSVSGAEWEPRYIRLRTVLDSLEATSLRYCLSADTDTERIRRAKKIESLAVPLLREIANLSKPKAAKAAIAALAADDAETSECPEGYNKCNGVCVPYPCP